MESSQAGVLHMEVTPDNDLDSVKYKFIFRSAYSRAVFSQLVPYLNCFIP